MSRINGANGSAPTGPAGMSRGSTEWGNSGASVIPSRRSFTCGRFRLLVFVPGSLAPPRFPLRARRDVVDGKDDVGFILVV